MGLAGPKSGVAWKFLKKGKYISECIKDTWKNEWIPAVPVFLSTPTGSGKTHFIIEELVRGVLQSNKNHPGNEAHVLILSNRTMLNRQYKKKLFPILDEYENVGSPYSDLNSDYTPKGLDSRWRFGNVDILTYQQYCLHLEEINRKYSFVVMDECHFFTSDSPFNADTKEIMDHLISSNQTAVRIYISATLNEVIRPLLVQECDFSGMAIGSCHIPEFKYCCQEYLSPFGLKDGSLKQIERIPEIFNSLGAGNTVSIHYMHGREKIQALYTLSGSDNDSYNSNYQYFNYLGIPRGEIYGHCQLPSALIYAMPANYDYIKEIHEFSNKDSLQNIIIQNQRKGDHSKWLIFVTSKSEGKDLRDKLNQGMGKNSPNKSKQSEFAAMVDADAKNTAAYLEIQKNNTFKEQVLISTSVLDNGIDIKDPLVKNLVIFSKRKTEFIQMLGRLRIQPKQEITLYLPHFSSADIDKALQRDMFSLAERVDFDAMSLAEQRQWYKGKGQGGYLPGFNSRNQQIYYNDLSNEYLINSIFFLKKLGFFSRADRANMEIKFEDNPKRTVLRAQHNYQRNCQATDSRSLSARKLLMQKALELSYENVQPKKINSFYPSEDMKYQVLNDLSYELGEKDEHIYEENAFIDYDHCLFLMHFLGLLHSMYKRYSASLTNALLSHDPEVEEICQKLKNYRDEFNDTYLQHARDLPLAARLHWIHKTEKDCVLTEKSTNVTREDVAKFLKEQYLSLEEKRMLIDGVASQSDELLLDKGFEGFEDPKAEILRKYMEDKGDSSKSISKVNEFLKNEGFGFTFQISKFRAAGEKKGKTRWTIVEL